MNARTRVLMSVSATLFVLLVGLAPSSVRASEFEKVEPPFWWQGFEDGELQLMIYGDDIGRLTASVEYPGVAVSRVEQVESRNYLFVYLEIDSAAKAGEFVVELRGEGSRLRFPYQLRAKNTHPDHAMGFSPADAIYLITPDRFVNGDPGNDDAGDMGDKADRKALGGRHGGDIQGIANSLDYISGMGFTAIWLNPVLENRMPSYSYHGYSTTDFYRVDPRYGSNESYRNLVETAKRNGIGVIMDMIVNHIGDEHPWMADMPAKDWVNNAGQYAETTHARTTWQDPYASEFDQQAFADGWFVPSMPDLNQRNRLMADYLTQNALWWIEYLGLTGIRMDTYPYPDKHFMTAWTRRVMQEYPNLNVVGEEWSVNPVVVSYWQKGKNNRDGYVSFLPSLMDFPVQHALTSTLVSDEMSDGSSWSHLYKILASDVVYPEPRNLVVFADNHDMSRVFTQLHEDYDLFRMAMVYVLTMRGTPQIYYGTEVLMANRGSTDHGLIRSEFPGGWTDSTKNAVTGEGLTAQEKDAQIFLRRLLNWRKDRGVIHGGGLMQFTPYGDIYSYFRYDENDSVMVIFNKGNGPATVDLSRYAERLEEYRYGIDVLSGVRLELGTAIRVPGRSVLLLDLSR